MAHWKTALLAIALAAAPSMALAARSLPPLKDQYRPTALAGAALNVADMERVRDFYVNVLGMKVIQRIPAQGPLREYVLSLDADAASGPTLVLTKTDRPAKASADFGRIIFSVPNAGQLTRRAAEAGYPPKRIGEGANMITDPEGHHIELFQAPRK